MNNNNISITGNGKTIEITKTGSVTASLITVILSYAVSILSIVMGVVEYNTKMLLDILTDTMNITSDAATKYVWFGIFIVLGVIGFASTLVGMKNAKFGSYKANRFVVFSNMTLAVCFGLAVFFSVLFTTMV